MSNDELLSPRLDFTTIGNKRKVSKFVSRNRKNQEIKNKLNQVSQNLKVCLWLNYKVPFGLPVLGPFLLSLFSLEKYLAQSCKRKEIKINSAETWNDMRTTLHQNLILKKLFNNSIILIVMNFLSYMWANKIHILIILECKVHVFIILF